MVLTYCIFYRLHHFVIPRIPFVLQSYRKLTIGYVSNVYARYERLADVNRSGKKPCTATRIIILRINRDIDIQLYPAKSISLIT